ncbi:acyltransferase [Photobacterium leiognathi]|uniref:acyltransferase n=1 Tax=Photobacterium leiognathi TaxID=553611 RepID=UPI000D17163F|nr:acyltransferase [Photobacterium leiognathi]PSW57539.1 acyltransferase [Photobacterium leiognathi subsp. mandapamensis]
MIGKLINLYYKFNYRFLLDKRVVLNKGAFVHNFGTFIVNGNSNCSIKIDDAVYIGRYANIHTGSKVTLSEGVVLSDYVYISTLSHSFNPKAGFIMSQPSYDKGEIFIGNNCFIGFGAKIMPNVSLGEWCIVGSGSVVTKSFPSYVMIAGNPAKVIKKYNREKNKWESV